MSQEITRSHPSLSTKRTFVSPNSISRIYALAPFETLSCLSSTTFEPPHLRGCFFPHSLHPEVTVPNFSKALREEEEYLYQSLARTPGRETSEAPMRRSNTEYHRQTLISFRRGQTVSMWPNFRGSSRTLDCASSSRIRIREDVDNRNPGEWDYIKICQVDHFLFYFFFKFE